MSIMKYHLFMNQDKTMGWEVFCGESGCRRIVSVPFSKITIVELVAERADVYARIVPLESCEAKNCGIKDAHSSTTDTLEIAYMLGAIAPEVVLTQE
jgi:hypothetical protein